MFITKIAKRLMATVMTTALVLTGFVVAPKEVSAAEATPEVKVLGATLRLDGNSGYQSMRVGIEIANASQAKACGVKLLIGEKTYTVATDVANGATDATKGTNIYDYNSETDTVIYTAVIKDIPKDAFTTEIGVQGTVKAISTQAETSSGDAIAKSIDGIVKELQKIDSTIKINDDGDLVRTVDGKDIAVTADDPIFTEQLSPTKANLDLSTYDSKGNNVTLNDDGSITVDFIQSYCGANIAVPTNLSELKYVELSVASTKDGTELDGGNQIIFRDTDGNELGSRYAKGIITFIVPDDKTLGSILINAQEASAETPQIMTISYIKLAKISTLDLTKFVVNGNGSPQINEDGSLTVPFTSNYTGSYLPIPEEYADCTYFEIGAKSVADDGTVQGTQVVFIGEDNEELLTNYSASWNQFTSKYEVPEGKKVTKIIVNTQDATADAPSNLTINYVKARA